MRIELEPVIFTADEHVEDVLGLLPLFRKGRHEWVVQARHVDFVDTYIDRHVSPVLARTYKTLARSIAIRRSRHAPGGPPAHLVPAERFSDAAHDLHLPAVIMVENNSSDGYFLEAVAHVVGAADVLKALRERWLEAGHGGGGGDLFRLTVEHKGRFRYLVRVAALIDSDRKLAGHPPKEQKKIDDIGRHGIRIHVLTRREIENYLPDKVLETACNPHQYAALQMLVPEQRAYLDIKKGYRDQDATVQYELFATAPAAAMEQLKLKGFGSDVVVRCLKPLLDQLTREDFAALGPEVINEFEAIVAMLREIV